MRDRTILAWRTAYYHRVKEMPDLAEELEAFDPPDEREVGPGGYMTEDRMLRVWGKIKAGMMAQNAALAAEAARG